MALGPGKYDDICTTALKAAKAKGVIVMIFNGEKGSGFSVQAPPDIQARLLSILRELAAQIESDFKKLTSR